MTPFQRYLVLQRRVLRGRALGTLPIELEDALLEEMDPLWYAMTDEERAYIDAGARDVPHAPTQLDAIDTDPASGTYRRAA
jgi:hypothetical protein